MKFSSQFWVLHGINYIVSNFKDELWEPLFPHLYDGTQKTLSQEEIVQAIIDRFGKDWSTDAKAAMTWAQGDPHVGKTYYLEASRRIVYRYGDEINIEAIMSKPKEKVVWEMFDHMKVKVLDRAKKPPRIKK